MDSPKFQWSKMSPDRGEQIVVRGDEYKQWVLDIEAAKQQLPKVEEKPKIVQQMEEFVGDTTPPVSGHICPKNPNHGEMKYRSGISAKTGKPYSFWSCTQKNLDGSWCGGNA
jgi:hypothetical protein